MTTAKKSDLVSFSTLSGVPVQPAPRFLTPATLAAFDVAFAALRQVCPSSWGKPIHIVHMGAFVDRPDPDGHDRHAQGRAIDLGAIFWQKQTVSAGAPKHGASPGSNAGMRHYLGVTAVFEKHIGCVLNFWQPDDEHRSHWHLDTHRQPGWSEAWHPSVRFLQAALKYIWGQTNIAIDGICRSKTQAAVQHVVGRPLDSASVDLGSTWMAFLDATAKKAFE